MIIFNIKVSSEEFKHKLIHCIELSRCFFIRECKFNIGGVHLYLNKDNEVKYERDFDVYSVKIDIDVDGILILGIVAVVNSYFEKSSCFVRTGADPSHARKNSSICSRKRSSK